MEAEITFRLSELFEMVGFLVCVMGPMLLGLAILFWTFEHNPIGPAPLPKKEKRWWQM